MNRISDIHALKNYNTYVWYLVQKQNDEVAATSRIDTIAHITRLFRERAAAASGKMYVRIYRKSAWLFTAKNRWYLIH